MLQATRLGKKYNSQWVFRGIEFCLEKGECLLVTGPNGSGKSTLLRLLAGLESPTEGSIEKNIRDARKDIGFASPELRLYANLTGLEHLQLTARLRGCDVNSGNTHVLLNDVGLSLDCKKPTSAYSTGMRARLRLAMAIQTKPKILLLDEPSVSLDENGREILKNIIANQRNRGCIILATNDPYDRQFGEWEINLGK